MERFTSLGIITSKEKIREVFHEIVADHETDTHIVIDSDDVDEILSHEGEARASFIVLQAPYKENLASDDFAKQLLDLSIDRAKGVVIQLITNLDHRLSTTRDIMATMEAHLPEECRILLGNKYEDVQDDVIFLFVITTGIA